MTIDITKPWQVLLMSPKEFLLDMAALGKYQDINLVGSFEDPDDTTKRTAHRDIPLPFHRDGIYDDDIAELQGGMYIAKPDVDVVGMYCLLDNDGKSCYTTLSMDKEGTQIVADVDLRAGEALIWNNRLWHARRGEVGVRKLIRFWTTCPKAREVEL